MEVEILKNELNTTNDLEVISLSFDLDVLSIGVIDRKGKEFEVRFLDALGFKCLDEGDLLNYWSNKDVISNNILKIINEGWLHCKSNKMIISHNDDVNEYLIRGIDFCVVILSLTDPVTVQS